MYINLHVKNDNSIYNVPKLNCNKYVFLSYFYLSIAMFVRYFIYDKWFLLFLQGFKVISYLVFLSYIGRFV